MKKCPVCDFEVEDNINKCPRCEKWEFKNYLGLTKEDQAKLQIEIEKKRQAWKAKQGEEQISSDKKPYIVQFRNNFSKLRNYFSKLSSYFSSISKRAKIITSVLFMIVGVCIIIAQYCCQKVCTLEDHIKMALVPKGTYILEQYPYVRSYIIGVGKKKIVIKKDFFIQTGEVTVDEFKRFVNSGWLSDEQLKRLGTSWKNGKDEYGKPYCNDCPVSNVPWLIAEQYAQWMSEQTGCQLLLPTKEQWAAAVMVYADNQTKQKRKLQRINTNKSEPDHLLFNREEWSRNSCGNGTIFILGRDYFPFYKPHDFKRLRCALKNASSSVGFRLIKEVLEEASMER